MAYYPCDVGLHRYTGPQGSAYVGVLRQSERASRKLRLCPEHLEQLLARSLKRADVDGQVPLPVLECWACGSDVEYDTRWAVFVTAYPAGKGREDYFGEFCRECVTAVGLTYSVSIP